MARETVPLPPGSATINFARSNEGVVFDAGPGNDTVLGSRFADLFKGGEGNDSLSGKKGNDVLEGGAGLDTVTGGEGSDAFVFAPGEMITSRASSMGHKGRVDTITDFQGAGTSGAGEQDVIRLEGFGAGTTLIYVGQEEPGRGSPQLYEVVDPTTSGSDGFIAMSLAGGSRSRLTADDYVVEPSETLRITNITEGGNGESSGASISADGSTVAFRSASTNLVQGETDTNGTIEDIFIYDVTAGGTINVTQGANQPSGTAALSADGSMVTFWSAASNLIAGETDANGITPDIFLHDLATGQTINVTAGANGQSYDPSISADGSTVAFWSTATDLVEGETDANGETEDIFVYDVATGEITNVTQGGNSTSAYSISLSANGSTLTFQSDATNLVEGQTDGNGATTDIFLYDVATGETTNVTEGGNAPSFLASVSDDGSTAAFSSNATNLVEGETDANGIIADIFLYDVASGETINLTAGADGNSYGASLSEDGSTVTFWSNATNLVEGETDANGEGTDVFVYDLATGETTNLTNGANNSSFAPVLAADGSAGAFESFATNLIEDEIDANGTVQDVFVFDLA